VTAMNDPNSDEVLATALMSGFIEKLEEGRPRQKYLAGKEEDRARAAMARLLRSGRPLTQNFRDRLAALFDPDDGTAAIDRKLIFKPRNGARRDHVHYTAVAMYVRNCIREGDSQRGAYIKAADHFNLTPVKVQKIWAGRRGKDNGLRGLLQQIDGPLPDTSKI
jgi:hypothetical protein